jgi:hypothetical protein
MCFLAAAFPVMGQQRPPDIDPNTKIEGGADVRGSGANAGVEKKEALETRSEHAEPEKAEREKDKPISARKPQEERERESAAKGESAPKRDF